MKELFNQMRHEVKMYLGRECSLPLDECSTCVRKLESQNAVLAALDVAEATFKRFQAKNGARIHPPDFNAAMRKACEAFAKVRP